MGPNSTFHLSNDSRDILRVSIVNFSPINFNVVIIRETKGLGRWINSHCNTVLPETILKPHLSFTLE